MHFYPRFTVARLKKKTKIFFINFNDFPKVSYLLFFFFFFSDLYEMGNRTRSYKVIDMTCVIFQCHMVSPILVNYGNELLSLTH